MHNLPARPSLAPTVQTELENKTSEILRESAFEAQKERAESLYKAEREKVWFRPVTEALKSASRLCMYCSFNEPTEVEHFRPKSKYPEQAFLYENYLWICSVCNRFKGDTFPTEPKDLLLNPFEDSVWDYFFLDDFGRLQVKAGRTRAASVCKIVKINRQTVQDQRVVRLKEYRETARATLKAFRAGEMSLEALRAKIEEMLSESTPADVGDYFLNGPGSAEEPFKSLLQAGAG